MSTADDQHLRQTPLYEEHLAAGGRMVPFAGWEMPVQYQGVKEEHLAVRGGCGVFDVSHMGEISTSGPEAGAFLQRLLSNDVSRIEVGGAQYSCLCAPDGGILDDLFTYRLEPDTYLTVTNASNHEADLAHFLEVAAGFEVDVADAHADWAMLAVQGPSAREIVSTMLDGEAELPPRMRTAQIQLAGADVLCCGTGYTGEAGVELMIPPPSAVGVWQSLLEAGAVPAGLGARDTLRLEVCFHLHGHEISPARNPIEAGLGWACKEETDFIGAEVIVEARAAGTAEKLVALAMTGPGIPRDGNPLLSGGEPVGAVSSGTFAPSLGVGAAMGYVRAELAEPGTALQVDVRGRIREAEVKPMPLYAKNN